VKHFIQIFR